MMMIKARYGSPSPLPGFSLPCMAALCMAALRNAPHR